MTLLRKDLKPGDCFRYIGKEYKGQSLPLQVPDDHRVHTCPMPMPSSWSYSSMPLFNIEVELLEDWRTDPIPTPKCVSLPAAESKPAEALSQHEINLCIDFASRQRCADDRIKYPSVVGGSEAWSKALRLKIQASDAERRQREALPVQSQYDLDDDLDE